MNDETKYHYARLIEADVPTRYARFPARKTRDQWVLHDPTHRYKVVPAPDNNTVLSQITWEVVEGISLATEPKVHPSLTVLLDAIMAAEKQIADLEEDVQYDYDEVAKMVAALYNEGKSADDQVDHACLIVDTNYECATSPTLRCVYPDDQEDYCLFCGEPEERK